MSKRQASEMRRAAAVLAAALVTTFATGTALAASPLPTGRIRLASQTTSVAPGGEFQLRLYVRGVREPDRLEVAVAVHAGTATRSQFVRTLAGRSLGSILALTSAELTQLVPDAAGAVIVRLGIAGGPDAPPCAGCLGLLRTGVHPVHVMLRESGGGRVVDELTTHLVHLAGPIDGPRLAVALVLPVDTGPTGVAAGRIASSVAGALGRYPQVPATLAIVPDALDTLAGDGEAGRAAIAALRGALGERQLVTGAYVPVDVGALLRSGLARELTIQLERGAEAVTTHLGGPGDRRTWLADGGVDERALAELRRRGIARIVLPESRFSATGRRLTLAQPFQVEAGGARTLRAAASDDGLAAHLSRGDDPVLAAHHVLADLAVVWLDSPGIRRGVVVRPGRDWRSSAEVLDTLLAGLAASPYAEGLTLADLFDTVPPALGTGGAPLVRDLTRAPQARTVLPAAAITRARQRVRSYRLVVEPDRARARAVERQLLIAEEAGIAVEARAARLGAVSRSLARDLGGIRIPRNRSFNLTARRGEIPVSFRNDTGRTVRVLATVRSDRLQLPEGSERLLVLDGRTTTERFAVVARSAGRFPLEIRLTSPDGRLVIGHTTLFVRSTAASGVGVVLTAGAGAFLLLWWGRHLSRGRRARRLVPA